MRIESHPEVEAGLSELLERGASDGTFPGAVACLGYVGREGLPSCVLATGGVQEPSGNRVIRQGPYDLASLTKPYVACAVLRLVARGELSLDEPVQRWVPELGGTLGGGATLGQLLAHRAGLSPWGGLFEQIPGPPGSDAARAFILQEAATRADDDPPADGGGHYSDLGYMIVGETLARAAGMGLDQVVQREVTEPLGTHDEIFYAASLSAAEREAWTPAVAPTEYCAWRGRVVRGEVHDENCAAFGGIAGHAGLFGSARGVARLGMCVVLALAGADDWLDPQLVQWSVAARPGGGYVAGWDTPSREGSSAGSRISPSAFGHLGFTGTSLWCDPERRAVVALLSNRVHPTRSNIAIRQFRPVFHDRALELYDTLLAP